MGILDPPLKGFGRFVIMFGTIFQKLFGILGIIFALTPFPFLMFSGISHGSLI